MNVNAPLLVIAAGGTGGHMFPAQALAEEMLARGWRVKLSTDARGARYTQGFPAGVEISQTASATFARGGLLSRLLVPFRILTGVIAATSVMLRDRPAAVIGFGGYPSIPALSAATLLRLPRAIHEQNGVLGRVNRRFAARVSAVACGTWPTTLPAGVAAMHTGNPVRAAVLERAGAGYIEPGDYPMELLVMGGSQGAVGLNRMVRPLLPRLLAAGCRVVHLSGSQDQEAGQLQHPLLVERPFSDEIPGLLQHADLVISRSGAGALSELAVAGTPAILVPYPAAADRHQC